MILVIPNPQPIQSFSTSSTPPLRASSMSASQQCQNPPTIPPKNGPHAQHRQPQTAPLENPIPSDYAPANTAPGSMAPAIYLPLLLVGAWEPGLSGCGRQPLSKISRSPPLKLEPTTASVGWWGEGCTSSGIFRGLVYQASSRVDECLRGGETRHRHSYRDTTKVFVEVISPCTSIQ